MFIITRGYDPYVSVGSWTHFLKDFELHICIVCVYTVFRVILFTELPSDLSQNTLSSTFPPLQCRHRISRPFRIKSPPCLLELDMSFLPFPHDLPSRPPNFSVFSNPVPRESTEPDPFVTLRIVLSRPPPDRPPPGEGWRQGSQTQGANRQPEVTVN